MGNGETGEGGEVPYDYILGSDCRIFNNLDVRDLQHTSNHCMVLGCLRGASPREHSHYLRGRTRLPLRPPGRQTRIRADKIFAELRHAISKPDERSAFHNALIYESTWRLVDKRVSTRQEPGRDQAQIRRLGQEIMAAQKYDS